MIAQCTAENDLAVERRKCNDEIASLEQIMKGVFPNSFAFKPAIGTLIFVMFCLIK